MKLGNYSITTKTLWLIAIVSLAVFFVSGRWHRTKVIDADVISYYSYLPAAIIEGDLKMTYSVGNDFYADKIWGVIWKENSGPVQKYTMGLSWLYLPFFLLGHLSALIFGFPAHGYSGPYNFWLQMSAIFYLMLGFYWLRKVLLQYFSEAISATVMLLLAFGTNLFYYTQGQATMPHVYLFALVSGLLWYTIRFREAPTLRAALRIGLICSLITLIRPNHLLLWGIPVFYGLTGKSSFWTWIQFWKTHWWRALTWPIILGLVILPQLFYWHLLTDHWVHYSYNDESFFWADPKVLKVFFSFRNGWLLYTPIMLTGLAGLFLLKKYAKPFAFIFPFTLIVAIYVISSWWCWWYGGTFGSRVFIDYYPMLAIGMGSLFTFFVTKLNSKRSIRIAIGVLAFFVILNQFQTFQYTRGIIHYDSMTPQAYFKAFGRDRRPHNQEALLDHPDYEAAKKGKR